jgi:Putative serine esterase (DUF676)
MNSTTSERTSVETVQPPSGVIPSERSAVSLRTITPPYYPIVFVRGYAMTPTEREEIFHDAYYGFAATSVEKRDVAPPKYFEPDIFEGQLMRLLKDEGYVDATNRGIEGCSTPERSIWISRFYDRDVFTNATRSMEDHAQDLCHLIVEQIPNHLQSCGVGLEGYKVILLAHSMGGLVCRTMIQNLLPKKKQDPKRYIHRFVTMATPHGGIELGAFPQAVQSAVINTFNPFDSSIFEEERMRGYLNLAKKNRGTYVYDVHSLADYFPVDRCLCLIGSDYSSYGVVRHLTGDFSDGLVKQDRAYLVGGPKPADGKSDYPEHQRAFFANVHRAHSGFRGIVNSFESYENIRRFLFGDVRFRLALDGIKLNTRRDPELSYFYDFEYRFSIRGTATYLHRRQQDPCENAIRMIADNKEIPTSIHLHTGFFDTKLRRLDDYTHFSLSIRVVEHRSREGLIHLFDHQYAPRQIYNEELEVRVGEDKQTGSPGVQYRWISDLTGEADSEKTWQTATFEHDAFRLKLREANSIEAWLSVQVAEWPNSESEVGS